VLAAWLVHGGPEADGVVRGGGHKEVRRQARRVDTARFFKNGKRNLLRGYLCDKDWRDKQLKD
jgi:hypothetical protein